MTTIQIPLHRQRAATQGAQNTLSNAPPTAQDAGEIAGSEAMANAANERLARALVPAMENLDRIERNQAPSRQESLYAEVKAEAIKSTMALRDSLAEDTDYDTHKARFGMGIVDIKRYAGEQLKGHSALMQRFDNEFSPYARIQDFDVRKKAVRYSNQQQVVGVFRRIHESAAAYSQDAINNDLVLSGTMREIDQYHNFGALSDSAAAAAKTQTRLVQSNTVIKWFVASDAKLATEVLKKNLSWPLPAAGSDAELAARRESGTEGSYAIDYDPEGGTSYGKLQLASNRGMVAKFIVWLDENGHKNVAAKLRSASPADTGSKTGVMPKMWKDLVASGEITDAMQEDFIRKENVTPALDQLALYVPEAARLIRNNHALASAAFSTAVQHGPGGAVTLMTRAWARSNGDPETFLGLLYEDRKTQFGSSPKAVRDSVIEQLDKERATVRAMYDEGRKSSSVTGDSEVDHALRYLSVARQKELLAEAEAAIAKQDIENTQRITLLMHNKEAVFAQALDSGDFSHAEQGENDLARLGHTAEAAHWRTTRDLCSIARPMLASVEQQPLAAQEAESTRRTIPRLFRA